MSRISHFGHFHPRMAGPGGPFRGRPGHLCLWIPWFA